MSLEVRDLSGLVTVQDQGRVGYAHLGVPRAGPLDRPAAELANRLVGNEPSAAVLEITIGAMELRARSGCWVAVTGARCGLRVDDSAGAFAAAQWVPQGGCLRIGTPQTGMRAYLAVAGGIEVQPVLGSRSTDTLAWVGPPPVEAGQVLPVGPATGPPMGHETPRPPRPGPLRVSVGPREQWFDERAWDRLVSASYVVGVDSNRIGVRLEGSRLTRSRTGELPSEGVVLGSVQVPPNGQPVVFLADHPTTGGYPVIGVVDEDDLWQLAQARPGESVSFSGS